MSTRAVRRGVAPCEQRGRSQSALGDRDIGEDKNCDVSDAARHGLGDFSSSQTLGIFNRGAGTFMARDDQRLRRWLSFRVASRPATINS
jgi:hypothetical protein